jgi:hypothetical protein
VPSKKKQPPRPTFGVWYHPDQGARIAIAKPTAYRDGTWTEVARLDAIDGVEYKYAIAPGQSLPRGYLWGDLTKQVYGFNGGFLAYAPIERRCSTCKEMFTWSARAQKHLYETIGIHTEKTARHCQSCARKRRALETARSVYATALKELEAADSVAARVRVAKCMLEILTHGGQVSIAKAIGHCTRARRLGGAGSVDAVETKLRALSRGERT